MFWCPVEHFPLMDAQKAFFDETSVTAVPMSKFGAKQFSEAGIEGADMIYHALDPALSTKGDKIEFRRDANIAVSDWVVGVVAANSDQVHSRKGFPVIFEAFSKLYSKYPDTHLFLHTKAIGGMNLNRMASKYGAPVDNIHVPTPDAFYMTQPIEGLRDKYAGFDVLLSPSLGEGFGIPVIEAQAQGTPVVVNDATAQSELVGAGHAIASGFDYWDETCGSFYRYPSAESAVVHLESLRERSSEDVIADSVAARKFVRRFDLKDVSEQWGRLLGFRGRDMTEHAYTTVEEVRRIFSKTDTPDSVYESAIRAATDQIDAFCSRRFDLTVAGIREFEIELDYLGGKYAEMTIDDIAVNGVTVPTVELATYPDDEDLWEAVDVGWWLGPRSPRHGWPYTEFTVRSPRNWQGFIRVTADFGWGAIPAQDTARVSDVGGPDHEPGGFYHGSSNVHRVRYGYQFRAPRPGHRPFAAPVQENRLPDREVGVDDSRAGR